MQRPLTAAILVGLAGPLAAQAFIVDAAGGAGSSFTQIAAAVAAVPAGSVLEVRPGVYTPFTITGKSLTILGGPGVRVYGLLGPAVGVTGLTSSDTVVLRGLELAAVSVIAQLSCRNSAGTILLEGCRSDPTTSLVGGQLRATQCQSLHLRDCSFQSTGYFDLAMQLDSSNVSVRGGSFAATNAVTVGATNSRLDLAGAYIGAGSVAPTIALHQSHLDVRATTVLAASYGHGAIAAGSGSVALDPAATLVSPPPQPFAPSLTLVVTKLPTLTATTGVRGGLATAQLSAAASLAVLALGAPAAPQLLPGIGQPAWLAPGTALSVAVGVPPLSGGYAVPNAPWVLGVTLAWQGAALGSGGVQLTNPAVVGHR
jgi:hypothetical protein